MNIVRMIDSTKLYDLYDQIFDYINLVIYDLESKLDTKFDGHGIFKVQGSQIRYHIQPSYTYVKNKKICF